ncbi:MAG TPA: hypothetical protein VGG51_11510 [Candidatus Cybelea sp.]|jgi:hypothetical protein
MKISSLANYAVGVTVAAALLAGCSTGGNSGLNPTMSPQGRGPGGTLSYNGRLIASAVLPQSRPIQIPVQPDKHKKKSADEYISNFYASSILEFNYPKSNSSVGTVGGSTDPQGMCTMNGKGTWWVVSSGSDQVLEYKAGGTSPITTLSVTAGEPAGCSVNSKGDVAVSILGAGDVVVFAGGKGSGTTIGNGLASSYFLGYDKAGDLFVDGKNAGSTFAFAEMKAGGKTFSPITVSNSILFPGQVQYDGTYITINDQEAHDIYQYTVKGSKATVKGTVALNGTSDCVQTWIAGKLVYCPDAGNENATVFKYPAGGNAVATLSGSFDGPIGSVSVKK